MIIKNGIEFQACEQKFIQGVRCDICDKKMYKGEQEYVSSVSPVMHLCADCAHSDKNIRGKKGMSIFINNRFYMFVEKGIRGNHVCDLTGEVIKQGTPCWWSSKKDDPNKKTCSYILSLESIDDKLKEANNVEEDVWYDKNYVDIDTKHFNEDTDSFCSYFGINKEEVICVRNQFLTLKNVVELKEKHFVGGLFWTIKGIIKFVPYDRLNEFFNGVELHGKVNELKVEIENFIVESYEEVGGIWKRILK